MNPETLQDHVDYVFADDGWLVGRGGYASSAQHEYARSIAEWIEGERETPVALIEGETGTGKTLGYIFPLLIHWALTGQRSVVATKTLALQKQMMGGDIDLACQYLSEMDMGYPLIAQRIGKHHYVDPDKAENLARKLKTEQAHRFSEWAKKSEESASGRIEEWLEEVGELPEGIRQDQVCISATSDEVANRQLSNDKQQTEAADMVVTSHMMVMLACKGFSDALGIADEDSEQLIVVDEGDLLGESAQTLSNHRIQLRELTRMASTLTDLKVTNLTRKANAFAGYCEQLGQLLADIDEHANESAIAIDALPQAEEKVNQTLDKLKRSGAELKKVVEREIPVAERSEGDQEKVEALGWVTSFAETENSQFGAYGFGWSEKLRIPSMLFYSPNPGFSANSAWKKMGNRVCLTSATLGEPGEPGNPEPQLTRPVTELGISPHLIQMNRSISPQVFGELDLVLANEDEPPPMIKDPDDEEVVLNSQWVAYIGSMVRKASYTGPTLVLVTSYDEAKALEERLPGDAIVQHHGERLSDCVERFKARKTVLVTPAGWQGLSIRNDDGSQLVTNLVISRIPLVPPDPVGEKLFIHCEVEDGKKTPSKARRAWVHRNRMTSLLRMRQGMGRLIRHRDDKGTLWIGDPRFTHPRSLKKSPLRYFHRAIPPRFVEKLQSATRYDRNTMKAHDVEAASINESDREFLLL